MPDRQNTPHPQRGFCQHSAGMLTPASKKAVTRSASPNTSDHLAVLELCRAASAVVLPVTTSAYCVATQHGNPRSWSRGVAAAAQSIPLAVRLDKRFFSTFAPRWQANNVQSPDFNSSVLCEGSDKSHVHEQGIMNTRRFCRTAGLVCERVGLTKRSFVVVWRAPSSRGAGFYLMFLMVLHSIQCSLDNVCFIYYFLKIFV